MDRLVILPVQPFVHLGIELYILGSLSCVASYSSDAMFNGWDKSPITRENIQNICHITYAEIVDMELFKVF